MDTRLEVVAGLLVEDIERIELELHVECGDRHVLRVGEIELVVRR